MLNKLNRFAKLSFKDKNLEKRFVKEYIKDNLGQNKFAIKVTLIAYLTYIPFGYFMTPEDFYKDFLLMLLLPILSSVIFLYKIEELKKNHLSYLVLYSLTISIPPIISLIYTDFYDNIYINNYVLVLIGVMVIYGTFFVVAFLTELSVFIFAIIVLVFSDLENSKIFYYIYYISVAFIVTSISSYLIEKSKRKIYADKYEIEKKDKFIEQQSRLAELGSMMSMIAHQWRQPLSVINSNIISIKTKIEIGKYNFDNENDLEKFLNFLDEKHQKILEKTEYLNEVIEVFRHLYKPDKKKKDVTVKKLIENALKILGGVFKKQNIKLNIEIRNNYTLNIYHNEFLQVLINILNNSVDNFIEKNIYDGKINILTYTDNKYYYLEISDNGGGIKEIYLNKIFDPYFSTKGEKNGTGLGLYMAKKIVEESHKGTLKAGNKKNGAYFEIILKKEY